MANLFESIVKDLGDEYTRFISEGDNSSEFTGTIDTGSYILNACLSGSLYGGAPNNKIIALAGEEATGKTFFALSILKRFLDDNERAHCFYFDTEAAVTKNMMESRGIDVNRVIVSEPESVQKFRTMVLKILENYIKAEANDRPPLMMILDSVGQLSTTKEIEDSSEGKETRDMTRAQVLKATFRVINLKLAKANVPLIVTNHVYDKVGSYIPGKEMSGGSGLKYTASQICFLSKKRDKDVEKTEGNIIKVRMDKSRFTRENSEVEVRLSYSSGLDRYYGLLDLAEKYGVIKKVSTRYEMPDGTKVFGKAINSEPEKYFTDELLAQLEECAKKEFCYGEVEEESYETEEV